PSTVTANALNVWTGSVTLEKETSYWIVFGEAATSYQIVVSTALSGGSGNWLTGSDRIFRYGSNSGTYASGALLIAIGATSVPSITSNLTEVGTYRTAFTYETTATNTPT